MIFGNFYLTIVVATCSGEVPPVPFLDLILASIYLRDDKPQLEFQR